MPLCYYKGHSDAPFIIDAKMRRILMTTWVGEAWERFTSTEYAATIYKCFQRTGCLLTADGSDDNEVFFYLCRKTFITHQDTVHLPLPCYGKTYRFVLARAWRNTSCMQSANTGSFQVSYVT